MQSFNDMKTVRANRIIGGGTEISLSDVPNQVLFRDQTQQYNNPIYIDTATGDNNLKFAGRELDALKVGTLSGDVI